MCIEEEKRIRINELYYLRSKKNARAVVDFRKNNKIKLISALGGKCEICGYDKKCSSAYHFHHKDKKEKEFTISRYMSRKFETLLEEAKKCMLLCSNCHAEFHDNEYNLSREKTIERWSNFTPEKIEELSHQKPKSRILKNCIYCKISFAPKYKTQNFCKVSCRISHNKEIECPENIEQLFNEIGVDGISEKFFVSTLKVRLWLVGRNLLVNKICETCKSEFYSNKVMQQFCSIRCGALSPKQRKVENRPTKEQIEEMLKTMPWTAIGRKYGVSDNAVRKWMK